MFLDATNLLTPNSPSIPTQLSAAMACGYILNAIRRSEKIPWVDHNTKVVSGLIRAGMAGAATLGISWQWSSANHTVTISGLTATTIVLGLWHWLSQYAAQHGFEQLLQIELTQPPPSPTPPTALVAILRRLYQQHIEKEHHEEC